MARTPLSPPGAGAPGPPAPSPASSAPSALDDPRLTAAGLLFEVAVGVGDALAGQIRDHGLTSSEFEVLLRLVRSPGRQLRMSDLAAQVNLSSSGLTRLVDRLERRDLIERRACPTDGRGAFAAATPAGADLLLGLLPGHVELIERWYTGLLDPEQLDQLSRALRTIRDVVRPHAAAGATPTPEA